MENVRKLTRRDFLKGAAKTAAVVAVSGALPSIIGCSGDSSSGVVYDTLIRGGEVYDGLGNAPRIADIGIIGDRIVAVGNLTGGGLRTIEAQGLLVCPGFIDVHTHVDISYLWLEPIEDWESVKDLTGSFNYLFQGVTTVVGGNCGYGYYGEYDIDYFFSNLEKAGYGTNICTLAAHGLIRQALLGDDQPKEGLSPQQFQDMENRFRCQMKQGTIGFSTGLEYAPGSYAKTKELVDLAKVVREYGGLYTSHTRDQTGKGVWGGKGVLASIDEAIEIGTNADIPVHVSHLQVTQPWSDPEGNQMADLILEKIENARAAIDITACIHTYDKGWSPLNYRLPENLKSNMGIKERCKEDARKAIEEVFEYLKPKEITVLDVPWKAECSMKLLSELPNVPKSGYEGMTPAECFVDLLARDQTQYPAPYGYFNEIKGPVKNSIIHGDHIFMSSDGFASSEDPKRKTPIVHPRSFNNVTRVLTKFVKPAQGAGMDFSTAISKMTSLPADKFKLRERGRIEEGYFADIVVIDREKLKVNADFEIENRYSEGVEYCLVNGVLAIDHGNATDQRAGKVLRRV